MPFLNTTAIPFSSGVTSVSGNGQDDTFTFSGTWATGDHYTILLTDSSTGVQYQYGYGQATGQVPSYCFTYQNKEYFLAGATVFFSTDGTPTQFNDVTSGSQTDGFVTMSNFFAQPENLVAMAPYQGKLVFFSRTTTQIWQINSDPALWVQAQLMQNIGTIAPASVVALGDLDVFFLADTGIRSLRVRDASSNAFVNDIGSPIDQLIQNALLNIGNTTAQTSCGIVDPSANRYWLAVNGKINAGSQAQGTIYALSYFPSSKVIAWSTYLPTLKIGGVLKQFNPIAFRIMNGQVYCYCSFNAAQDKFGIVVYGGSDNNTYDDSTLTVQTPYLDAGAPGNRKSSVGVDCLMSGIWTIKGNMNIYDSTKFKTVMNAVTQPTTENNQYGWTDQGSHMSLLCTCSDSSRAVLSLLNWHFTLEDYI